MDVSGLIFVALAVAWAVYLVPKAIAHHDEVIRSRSVERFSHTMRVLARREPISGRSTRLVVAPVKAVLRPKVETKARANVPPVAPPVPSARLVSPAVRRAAARKAARRRRNVLGLVLLANLAVVALAVAKVVAWPWVAVPAALLVAWLGACRVSVRAERRVRTAGAATAVEAPESGSTPASSAASSVASSAASLAGPTPADLADLADLAVGSAAAEVPAVLSGEIPIISESVPGAWDMLPTPLPTYVTKPAAPRRSVSAIDLDSTGVWSSGRSEIDSALAREAELVEKAEKVIHDADARRANGA